MFVGLRGVEPRKFSAPHADVLPVHYSPPSHLARIYSFAGRYNKSIILSTWFLSSYLLLFDNYYYKWLNDPWQTVRQLAEHPRRWTCSLVKRRSESGA
ncbi:MAG: hypothetical protein UY30_C0004G0008 [Parcubacteria group bacterium GW2011_GWB1_48_6]|nr:MAG: hypothetical protein UY30_C0004G0008 [Parcubacteria group bacterium GW2011_GWB1_48_6]